MTAPYAASIQSSSTTDEEFITAVVSRIPGEAERARVEMDLVRRIRGGESVADLMARYGDPMIVAESYLASVPLESAPFFRRLAAAVIDIPSVMASGFTFFYFAWKLIGTGESFIAAIMTGRPLAIGLCIATLVLMSPLYYIISETTTSQTVGKALMGIRTVRESGAKISIGQAVVRQIPLFFSFYVLDAAFALFTEKKQRLFELISRTRVVRAR
jgi:uncharacterized RDD family membrane protein YckC